MSLAHKLYKIGQLVSKEEIKEIIEVNEFDNLDTYRTLQIDLKDGMATLKENAIESSKTMFTKKIGGTSNSYYLYPNFEYQKEKDLYKKFQAIAYTFENSIMVYANEANQKLAKPAWRYIQEYREDILGLKDYKAENYFVIITINGKTLFELMPEIWDNYYEAFVEPHITKTIQKVDMPQLQEEIDFVTHEKVLCGYSPNVKFFTMDNYNDAFKPQIINKLPLSKESAIAIKKGWMYAMTHLKFYHKGLEYIIIPSMVNYNEEMYKELLKFLKKSGDKESLASREDSFIRRLSKQIEEFHQDKINSISLDILFTEVNLTNLSVKIFATLEDVLPSRIRNLVRSMQEMKIVDKLKRETNSNDIHLREYFSREELFAIATKNTASMKNRIIQEKIYLAKLLLGYATIDYIELLKRFEFDREYDYEHKKKLSDVGIKEWITYPNSFVSRENAIIDFLTEINAIKNRRL
jgi:CRISPR-associated protein Csh1